MAGVSIPCVQGPKAGQTMPYEGRRLVVRGHDGEYECVKVWRPERKAWVREYHWREAA